jgi:lincosamide nucleotidyltransferase A/C/D/E
MRVEDVVWVLGILDAAGVPFCLAGGWGVDALLGRQSRAHHDLDVVVDDYDLEVPRAIAALQANGFEVVATHERRAWMPRLAVLTDDAGHQVEFVSLDWNRLALEFAPPGADGTARKTFEQRVFAEGTVGGRRVPCLSAEVQLLYHIGFELAPDMQRDLSLLHDELGAVLSDSPET